MESFEEYSEHVNKVAESLQVGEAEIISHEDAALAAAYIRDMEVNLAGDAFIYCAALNLLNTYVKQKDAEIDYRFKNKLAYCLQIVAFADIKGVKIDFQADNDTNLVVTQIGKIQFSFHNVRVSGATQRAVLRNPDIQSHIEWDGIRKQRCASTVFRLAVENQIEVSDVTFRGKNLSARVERTLDNYKRKLVSINSILFD